MDESCVWESGGESVAYAYTGPKVGGGWLLVDLEESGAPWHFDCWAEANKWVRDVTHFADPAANLCHTMCGY